MNITEARCILPAKTLLHKPETKKIAEKKREKFAGSSLLKSAKFSLFS